MYNIDIQAGSIMNQKERFENIIMHDLTAHIYDEDVWTFLCSLDPNIEVMKDYEQNHPYHWYDLMIHTTKTVDSIRKDGLTEDEYRLLKVAGFFHDIGKPKAAEPYMLDNGEQRTGYRNHPEYSEEIALPVLEKLGYEGDDLRRLRFYIVAHDLFLYFLPISLKTIYSKRLKITKANIRKIQDKMIAKRPDLQITRHDFTVLLSLSQADASAHGKIVRDMDGNIIDSDLDMTLRAAMIQKVCEIIENENC